MEQQNLENVQPDVSIAPAQTEAYTSALTDTKVLNTLSKMAGMFARSRIVPELYQNSPDNCFVACELANRMGVSPMIVMQNLYIVKGKPTWSGSACISLINGTRLFSPLKFMWVGEKGTESWGCYVQATRLSDGEVCSGSIVDMAMVKAEGWLAKNGSKWATMPEQMFMYRAAAFFARVFCPHALMGLQTAEEVQDVNGYDEPTQTKTITFNREADA